MDLKRDKRQNIQKKLAFSSERVKPVKPEEKRPNRVRRCMNPKAQLTPSDSWRKYVSEKICWRHYGGRRGTKGRTGRTGGPRGNHRGTPRERRAPPRTKTLTRDTGH